MTAVRNHSHSPSTPRRFVVGLLVFAAVAAASACHQQPAPAPAPTPSRPVAPAPAAITNGQTLIRAIHDRYASTWYHTLTFTQKTTLSQPNGGEIIQTWFEAGEMPGKLRIDTDISSKSGVLYAKDSIFSFANGKLVRADTGLNELLVLGFDMYSQPAAKTDAVLRHLGFDLTKFHESVWRGEPVYVVGALRGDSTSRQFWVTKDNLLFVREITRGRQGPAEFRFNRYIRENGGWIASEVEQLVNGSRRVLEQYTNIRVDAPLAQGFLEASQWATAPHWYKP